jgi:3-oxoacyl-[acyl-carrier protein] reductase
MDLSGARVLVTGGSRGIGRAVASLLRDRGAHVAICGRDEAALRKTAEALGCHAIVCDVSKEDQAQLMVEEAISELVGLDVLINNAAIGTFGTLVDSDGADFERTLKVNVLGAYYVARSAARHFIDNGGGHILNVASTAARKGFAGGGAYAASKFALSALTECWRAELRGHDIRVMQINPSEVQTGFGGRDAPDHNPSKLQAEDVAQAMVDMLEMPDRGFITETTLWATNPK